MTMCMLGGDSDEDYGTTTFASDMELRDYFAANAMQEMFDAGWIDSGMIEEVDLDHLAKWSYIMADAMMKARDNENN